MGLCASVIYLLGAVEDCYTILYIFRIVLISVIYAGLFAKPRCRYQPSRANSKISYTIGNWYASPHLRRKTAATESSFLAAATTSG